MQKLPSTEAKARFAELLRTVENGETIAITRHGKTIAHVVPAPDQEQAERDAAVDRFLELRARWEPTGMTEEEILAARHEGHRM
ncbi:MAG: type II toxin-antitoxin system prevent-host-death family antitoxin [Chloroflexota bacterium]|nr:type II toxin-antitoxin system prevent-host-death family antitoxin [Chloroflexota bacterium]